jgi:hypothetical protein
MNSLSLLSLTAPSTNVLKRVAALPIKQMNHKLLMAYPAHSFLDHNEALQSTSVTSWSRLEGVTVRTSVRRHWPMHGPHALARTVPPTFSNVLMKPSRSMVARICSLPGVMVKGTLLLIPAASACSGHSLCHDSIIWSHNSTGPLNIATDGQRPHLLHAKGVLFGRRRTDTISSSPRYPSTVLARYRPCHNLGTT